MSATYELRQSAKEALRIIESEGECRSRDIVEATGYDRNTISQDIQILKKRRLIDSRPCIPEPRADVYYPVDDAKRPNTEV